MFDISWLEAAIFLAAVLLLVGLAWAVAVGIPRFDPRPATTAWAGTSTSWVVILTGRGD